MQFVYLDLDPKNYENGPAIHNQEDVSMSPIVLWKDVIGQYKAIDSMVIVCNQKDYANYEGLVACCHLSGVVVLSTADLEIDPSAKLDKIEVVKKLKEKQFVTSPSVFICYQACIPSKGLSLSILNDYYAFKHAKCVYLYNYSEDISKQPVTAAMSKNVSPLLQIDVDYLLSVGVEKRSPYTLVNLFNGSTFGLWVPFLPLAILSPSSLQKGIRIFHSPDRDLSSTPESVSEKCYSRIGLIGNPSDGYYGKTISIAISNFFTEVTLLKSRTLRIIPNPTSDPTSFTSFSDLHHILSKNGYTGGIRLLYASLNRFYKYLMKKGIYVNQCPFTMSYTTSIPRQVGLSGSSSIIIAAMRALIAFYRIPKGLFPEMEQIKWALQVETEELGITAGLQDRVAQVMEGCVRMDFNKEAMEKTGNGLYSHVEVALLPPLFLAYCSQPEDISFGVLFVLCDCV
ncbi:hypothetical protein WA577_004079 [Blastocystis sp. JDR]